MYQQQNTASLQPSSLAPGSVHPEVQSPQPALAQNTISPPPKPEPVGKKHKRHFKRVGWIQVVLGVASIILGITNISLAASKLANGNFEFEYHAVPYISCGIWSGVLILICGILGIRATKDTSSCSVIGGLVMTIIAALSTICMFAIELIGGIVPVTCVIYSDNFGYRYYNCKGTAITVIHYILVAIAVISFVVAIVHSGFSCATVCCRETPLQTNHVSAYITTSYVQQPNSTSTGTVQINPNPQFVQQPHLANVSYPRQPQYYYPQQNMSPYPTQPQMVAPAPYPSVGTASSEVQKTPS